MDDTSTPRARGGRPKGVHVGDDGLTERQRRMIDAIRTYIQRHGYPPSVREIGQAVGLSSCSSVAHQLTRLQQMGLVAKDPYRPRAYCLLDDDFGTHSTPQPAPAGVAVPLVGQIAAGAPILAEEAVEDQLTLPRRLVGGGQLFALEVEIRRVPGRHPAGPAAVHAGHGFAVSFTRSRENLPGTPGIQEFHS
ncbi:LexA family protein [Kitasatospora sp. NPDC101447]|uniref:LexA family protein n=1 Tax=Kitasatospora sp. NPDC101447 TaxID=3364102 RepID=UPI0038091D0E